MKRVVVLVALFMAVFATTAIQAAILPTPFLGDSTSNIQLAGVVCGPGFHLSGVVCVRNAGTMRECPPGWHLGSAGARCRRN